MGIVVTNWIPYDEAIERTDIKGSIGGMGGWFDDGMRWADFIGSIKDEYVAHYEALRSSILTNDIRHGGNWHQSDDDGVPVFSDGTYASFSYRAWGDLLAAVWSEHDDTDYNYMTYYMT